MEVESKDSFAMLTAPSPQASVPNPHRLIVLGIGLDGPQGLTPAAQAQLEGATVIAGFPSHLKLLGHHPARQICLNNDLDSWVKILQQELAHRSVVLLTSGDPLLFGLGRLLVNSFPHDQLQFFPHLSSVQLAFSRIQLPWHNATLISIHGRSVHALETALKRSESPIAVLTDSTHSPGAIAGLILDLRLPCSYRMWICSHLGAETEQVIGLDPQQARGQVFSEPNVVILERVKSETMGDSWPLLGLADRDFHTVSDQPGLITKQEVRALTLCLLQLPNKGVIWDIGAGTGSLSIEIARLSPQTQIYAIEKTMTGIQLIRQNCQRFHTSNVHPVPGQAPQVLADLPQPHRVILGGGGSQISAILDQVCRVLPPGGILVGNFATLERCWLTQSELQNRGWPVQLLQVNLARSVAIAGSTRFSPLNPVILLQASRPNGAIRS